MVVAIPPISVAMPIGISTDDGAVPVRRQTATRIGNNITTIGVLFRNALATAPSANVTSSANVGLLCQLLDIIEARGCNAPVVSSPLLTINNAQIVMSASCPKELKKSDGRMSP
jgi:hypothetical protein